MDMDTVMDMENTINTGGTKAVQSIPMQMASRLTDKMTKPLTFSKGRKQSGENDERLFRSNS